MRKYMVIGIALGFFLLLPAARGNLQPDPKSIIEKAVKAHGGEDKLAKLNMARMKLKGTMQLMGLNVAFNGEVLYQLPDKSKTTLTVEILGQKVETVQVLNGKKAWVVAMGMEMEIEGEQLKAMQEEGYANKVEMLVPLLKEPGYKLTMLGEFKVNNKPAVGVKVASEGHKDIELYFDKETGLTVKLVRVSYDPLNMKDATYEAIYQDHKDLGGVKHATKVQVNQDGKKYMDMQIIDLQLLDKIDPKEFGKTL